MIEVLSSWYVLIEPLHAFRLFNNIPEIKVWPSSCYAQLPLILTECSAYERCTHVSIAQVKKLQRAKATVFQPALMI